jgi:hypothetical protein
MSRNVAPVSTPIDSNAIDSAETIAELQSARAEVDKRDSAAEKVKALRSRLFGKFARAIIRNNADDTMDLHAMTVVLAPFYAAFKIKRLTDAERNMIAPCLRAEFQTVTF